MLNQTSTSEKQRYASVYSLLCKFQAAALLTAKTASNEIQSVWSYPCPELPSITLPDVIVFCVYLKILYSGNFLRTQFFVNLWNSYQDEILAIKKNWQMSCQAQRCVAIHFLCAEKFLRTQIFVNRFSLAKITKKFCYKNFPLYGSTEFTYMYTYMYTSGL